MKLPQPIAATTAPRRCDIASTPSARRIDPGVRIAAIGACVHAQEPRFADDAQGAAA